jgi:glycosyltransferase involved in cell wall biosynthesis
MPEVAGDAAILLTPQDPQPWVGAMLDLASNPGKRPQMSAAGCARAKQFDWAHSAASMLAIYEDAVRLPKRVNTRSTVSSVTGPGQVENVS